MNMDVKNIKISICITAVVSAFLFYNYSFAEERIVDVNSQQLYKKLRLKPEYINNDKKEQVRIVNDSYLTDIHCSHSQPLFAASFRNGQVNIHNALTGVELNRIQAHATRPKFAWFSKNGHVLASTSYQDTPRFWDVSTGKELFNVEMAPHTYPVLYGEEHLILAGSDISIINLRTGILQFQHLDFGGVYTHGVADSKNKSLYLVAYNAVYIFDIKINGDMLTLARRHREMLGTYGKRFNWAALINNGKTLVLASRDGGMVTVNTDTYAVNEKISERLQSITSFNINQEGDFIVAGKTFKEKNTGNSTLRQKDIVYKGNLNEGITHHFNLNTAGGAYTCFRDSKNPEALIGTHTNIISIDFYKEIQL